MNLITLFTAVCLGNLVEGSFFLFNNKKGSSKSPAVVKKGANVSNQSNQSGGPAFSVTIGKKFSTSTSGKKPEHNHHRDKSTTSRSTSSSRKSKSRSSSSKKSKINYNGVSQSQYLPLKPILKNPNHKLRADANITEGGFVYVNLPLNEWTKFYFGEVGQLPFSRWTFTIPAEKKCHLQVVDSYCTGDYFEATRLLPSGKEELILSTPPVPFNPIVASEIKAGGNVNCTPFTTDAETAWASSAWSKGEKKIHTGTYKMILKPLLAPYGSGGAYVRLDCKDRTPVVTATPVSPTNPITTQSKLCSVAGSTIKYIRDVLPFTNQAAVCQAQGLRPIDITAANFNDALNVLFTCSGANTRAWVSSYHGDNYLNRIGLSLHVGTSNTGGSVSANPSTSALEGVLCQ